MTDYTDFERLADEFVARAEQREAETPGDQGAAIMRYCAAELRKRIAAQSQDEWATTAEVAAATGKSVAAVQYWCRKPERFGLTVVQKPAGDYLIRRRDVLRKVAS